MSERIVMVVYRPFPGKEKKLEALLSDHVPRLRSWGLVTDREPIIMRANNGCFVEVFEWISAEAIAKAHHHPGVQALWAEFEAVCQFEKPSQLEEFNNLFSEFEPIQ